MRKLYIFLALSTLSLSACSDARDRLGLTKKSPDEFAVIKRAPLELPPNLVQLPVPRPGVSRPQESSAEELASTALFGETGTQEAIAQGKTSEAEQNLLSRVDADQAEPDIRAKLEAEADEFAYEDQAVIDKLLNRKIDASGSVVDPKAEAARIKQNIEDGKPLTQGDTSVFKQDE